MSRITVARELTKLAKELVSFDPQAAYSKLNPPRVGAQVVHNGGSSGSARTGQIGIVRSIHKTGLTAVVEWRYSPKSISDGSRKPASGTTTEWLNSLSRAD